MLSIEPEKTRAVLIGASRFSRDPDNLPPLPAVKSNISDLKKVLADGNVIGIPPENITDILDESNPARILEELAKASREAEDTLIVYYAGHGLVGKTSPQFFLATEGTTDEDLEYNSIPFENVRRAINETGARKKILIIDACYSGRALDIMGTKSSILQSNIDLKGTFAIASAPSNQPAIAPKGEKHTAFTAELLKVLNEGIDNGREEITLREIHEQIRAEFRRRTDVPEPKHANIQDADRIIIARNRRYGSGSEKLLEEISRLRDEVRKREESIDALKSRLDKLSKEGVRRILPNLSIIQGILVLLALLMFFVWLLFGQELRRVVNISGQSRKLEYLYERAQRLETEVINVETEPQRALLLAQAEDIARETDDLRSEELDNEQKYQLDDLERLLVSLGDDLKLDIASEAIMSWVRTPANEERLTEWLQQNQPGLDVFDLIWDPIYGDVKWRIMEEFGIGKRPLSP